MYRTSVMSCCVRGLLLTVYGSEIFFGRGYGTESVRKAIVLET